MNPKLQKSISKLDLNEGLKAETLKAVAEQLSIKLPNDYIEFMVASNGAIGFIGKRYLSLWKVEELQSLNEAYNISEFFPGLVAFRSDGGDEGYAFRNVNDITTIVQFPLSVLSPTLFS